MLPAGVMGLMNVVAAIEYNKKKYYSWRAIKLIQKMIGTTENGIWDGTSVGAVAEWQRSVMRLRPMTADGMFGPTSLGILIEEMVINGKSAQAELLRQFKHKDKHGNIIKKEVVDSSRPIYTFFQYPRSPLDLRRHPTNPSMWMMKGSFNVEVFIDQQIEEPSRYEYRQFIKGQVWVHDGYFGDPGTNKIWHPRAGTKQEPVNNAVAVPGGLNSNFFTEDGQVLDGGSRIEYFGYRSKPPTNIPGLIDEYSNYQTGAEYRLRDTFGIEGPRKQDSAGFKTGLKVGVDITYRGIVIKDGKVPTFSEINGNWLAHCVAGKEWRYKEEKFVTW